jgi:hypothetical protein
MDDWPSIAWFGKYWGAPICDEADHVDTPIDEACPQCHRVIRAGDDGLIIPLIQQGGLGQLSYHLDCFLETIGAGAGRNRNGR